MKEKITEEDIGKIIRERRIKFDLTQKQVADYVGVVESTVSRWESGDIGNMRRDKIARLAKILKVSPLLFITGVEDEVFKPEETELITSYRKLNSDGKMFLKGIMGQLKNFTVAATL